MWSLSSAAAKPASVRDPQSAFRPRTAFCRARSTLAAASRSRGLDARFHVPVAAVPIAAALPGAPNDACSLRPSNIYTARFFNKDPGLTWRFFKVFVIAFSDHLNCYLFLAVGALGTYATVTQYKREHLTELEPTSPAGPPNRVEHLMDEGSKQARRADTHS